MRPRHLTVLLLLALALPGRARADIVTLEALEKSALEHRPTEADDARVRATDADVRKAASGYYPRVGMTVDASASPGSNVVTVAEYDEKLPPGERPETYLVQGAREFGEEGAISPQFRSSVGLTAQANLYDFGRTKAAVEAGKATRSAVRASGQVTQEGLVRSVRGAYLSWLGAYEQLRLAQNGRDDASKRAARVRALVAEGVRPGSDVAPAETELLLAELELTRAKGGEVDARLLLQHTAATPLPSGAEPDLSLLDRDLPADVGEPESDAGYRALMLQRDAAAANARALKKERMPVLGAGLAFGVRYQNEYFFPSYSAGVNLTVPLWDGGLSNASSTAAQARGDELSVRMRERTREQKFVDERARARVEQAKAQLTVAEALRGQCEKRLAEAEEGYQVSAFGIDQVYQARAVLRRAESAVLDARMTRTSAVLEVAPVASAR